MKARIEDWDDAVKSALADSKNWDVDPVKDDSIFGIRCQCGDWGMAVEGNEKGRYFCTSTYAYPMCVVDKLQDEKLNSDDVLQYGVIITDDDVLVSDYDTHEHIRIRLIAYNDDLYYHKMIDGDVVECRKVGKADA